jgi:hypothetical protein
MRLTPPKQVTFIVAILIGLVSLLGGLGLVAGLEGDIAYWLAFVAFALLALAAWVPGV